MRAAAFHLSCHEPGQSRLGAGGHQHPHQRFRLLQRSGLDEPARPLLPPALALKSGVAASRESAAYFLPMNLWNVLPASCRQGGRLVLPTRCRQHVGSWPVSRSERNKGLAMNRRWVGQAFQPAGATGFPARRTNWGLESPQNRPPGKAALQGSWLPCAVREPLRLPRGRRSAESPLRLGFLGLVSWASVRKRRSTAAVQDAGALRRIPECSWPSANAVSQSLDTGSGSMGASITSMDAGSGGTRAFSASANACWQSAIAFIESVYTFCPSAGDFMESVYACSESIHAWRKSMYAFSEGIGAFRPSMAAFTAFHGQYRPGLNRFRASFQDCGGRRRAVNRGHGELE